MKYGSLTKRLDLIQPEECPRCAALAALTDEELDNQLKALIAYAKHGEPLPESYQDLPEHRPGCPEAIRDRELSPSEREALIKSCEDILEHRLPEDDPDKDICPWCNCHIRPDQGSYTGPMTHGRRICEDCYMERGSQPKYSTPAPSPVNATPGPDALIF
jgi:hypothetical protein